jgi:hypothetical protein
MQTKIVFEGNLAVFAQLFDSYSGEITFRGNFGYGVRYFQDLPFLRLIVEFDDHNGTDVDDEYCTLIPYLKQSRLFRGFIQHQGIQCALLDPCISECAFLQGGLHLYSTTLGTYSETKALVNQAKGSINRLDPSKRESRQVARDVLKALGVTPCTDLEFVLQNTSTRA